MTKDNQTKKRPGAKYEITLAEFPVFLLSKKEHRDIEAIEYQDQIAGKDGEVVTREWKVYPNKRFGLGTESTFETFFELFQIWKENNFSSQYIHFVSIYNLLKRQGKGIGVKEYNRIVRDLNCLVGITIEAKNAFWDNDLRAYVDMTFHLFDQLELSKDRAAGPANKPFCSIKASDILYSTVCKNSLLITDFDRKFFHGLTPLEQRLALYLSKIFICQTTHKREICEFARQLPIYAQQKYHVKLQLKRGCSGLMDKGFEPLKSFGFEKGVDKGKEFIVFKGSRAKSPAPPSLKQFPPKQPQLEFKSDKSPNEIEYLVNQIMEFCKDQQSRNFYKKVARLMSRNTIFRALSEVKGAEDMNKIKKSRGAHFTYLVKKFAEEQGISL
jgi:hypothetical protein